MAIITNNTQGSINVSNTSFKAQDQSTTLKHRQHFINELKQYYNLRKPKDIKPTTVFFIVRINNEQVRITTGYKVYPYHWNKDKAKETVPSIENTNNKILNEQISIYNQRFEEYKYLVNCEQLELNKETLRNYIKYGIMEIKKQQEINIPKQLREYLSKDTSIKDSTKENYYRFIDKFENYLIGKELNSYSDINSKLFRGFQEWLINNVKGSGKNQKASPQSINKIMDCTLKLIKKYLVINDFITGSQFKDIVVEELKEVAIDDEIALMDDDIMLLYNHKCNNKQDEEIKDIFLLECTTGQRISDIDKVDDYIEHKDNRTYINLIQDKTSEKVQVDIIFDMALEILAKYNYKLPTHHRKIFNKRIKEIAKEAGITGKEQIRRHQVGESNIIIEDKERYNCISSHTGRRTFITMLSLRGMTYGDIARYSGHSTLEMVQRYDKSKQGTKTKVMFEELKKKHPELILKLVTDKEKLSKAKESISSSPHLLFNDNEKVELEYYAVDRDIDVTKLDLTNDELKWLDKVADTFEVGVASLKIKKILNRLIPLGIVVRLKS